METAHDNRLYDRCHQSTSPSLRVVGILTEIVVRGDVFRDDVLQRAVSVDCDCGVILQ